MVQISPYLLRRIRPLIEVERALAAAGCRRQSRAQTAALLSAPIGADKLPHESAELRPAIEKERRYVAE